VDEKGVGLGPRRRRGNPMGIAGRPGPRRRSGGPRRLPVAPRRRPGGPGDAGRAKEEDNYYKVQIN